MRGKIEPAALACQDRESGKALTAKFFMGFQVPIHAATRLRDSSTKTD
jgi:hypothetical protein